MKKRIIFAAVVALLGVSAYVGVNAQQKDAMSDIQMANVEALVSGESGDRIPCHSSANQKYGKSYVDCSKCERIEDWEGSKTESRCTRG